MDAIYNERVKLFATFVNSVGVAIFAVGGVAPMVSALYGPTGPTLLLASVSTICIVVAGIIHYSASTFLKRMRP